MTSESKSPAGKSAAPIDDPAATVSGDRRQSGARDRRQTEPSTRRGRVSSGLALIFASIALLATGYLWYTLIYERQDLLQMDVPGTLSRLDRDTKELKDRVTDADDQISTLTETQETLKAGLDKIQADLGRNRAEWIVSEAEQLLLIANRRLQLARDVASALSALRAADRQLELLASPALLPVRRALSKEIATLESVERTDVAGISLKVGTLAETIDRLPLARELQPTGERVATASGAGRAAEEPKASVAREMWRDVLSLVRIRRHDTAEKPLLPPEQQYFIRENLRLMLYGAQHALLQGNVATYQQNLKTAGAWMQDYFDPNSQSVAAAQSDLERLRATPIMTDLPDITASLELLRKISGHRREP